MHHMITTHALLRQTDRQTDEHHGNSATIRSIRSSVHFSWTLEQS